MLVSTSMYIQASTVSYFGGAPASRGTKYVYPTSPSIFWVLKQVMQVLLTELLAESA